MFSDIFSSITSGVKAFSDWIEPVSKAYDEVSPVIKAATKGLGAMQASAEKRQQAASSSSVGGNMQGVNQQFDPTKTGYGLEQYANDAAAIENRWKQVLTQFVSPTQVK